MDRVIDAAKVETLIQRWQEDVDYPISKKAHPDDAALLRNVKQATKECIRELKRLLPEPAPGDSGAEGEGK